MKIFQTAVGALLFSGALVTAKFGQDVTDDKATPFSFKWTVSNKMPTSRSDLTATLSHASGKNQVYLIGGCNADQGRAPWDNSSFACPSITSECQAFDPSAGTYAVCAVAPRARYRHAATNVGGKIYLIGGRDLNDKIIETIDVYDPETDTWSSPFTWPDATSDLAAFTVGDQVGAVGGYTAGYNASKKTTKLEVGLRSGTGSIIELGGAGTAWGELHEARGDIFAAQSSKYVYVGGGFSHHDWCNPLQTFERYDRATGEWAKVASIGVGRGDKAFVAANGWVFAIGGEHNAGCTEVAVPVDNVDVYDEKDDTWTEFPGAIPEERFRFVAANGEDNHIYVFGGQNFYDETCDCYAVSDHVLSMEVSNVKKFNSAPSLGPRFVGTLSLAASLLVFIF